MDIPQERQACGSRSCDYGTVQMFEMNDRCAAGTGRFFEVLSRRLLRVPMEEVALIARDDRLAAEGGPPA